MDHKRDPISLEELRKQREKQAEAISKPKFLTKEQRDKLSSPLQSNPISKSTAHLSIHHEAKSAASSKMDIVANHGPSLLGEREIQSIKERYLGPDMDTKIKKPRRFTDKRFTFDWDASDDTSTESTAVPTIINHGKQGNVSGLLADKHWSQKKLEQMKERDWRIFKEDYNISTQGGVAPHPLRYWNEAAEIPEPIRKIIKKVGYDEPTPIQRQAIPIALQRRDVLGIAETGSGKTAAFIIPMVSHIMKLPKLEGDAVLDGPFGLILVPTRELALQIEKEANKFTQPLGFTCRSIVGGQSIAGQSFHMRMGAEIVVATPGRLRDCLEQRVLVLGQCRFVVLDEADRMIDMNYEEDLTFILETLPPEEQTITNATNMTTINSVNIMDSIDNYYHGNVNDDGRIRVRQTTMFSATMPPTVEKLARAYLWKPLVVTVGQAGQAVDSIEQQVIMMSEGEKGSRLVPLLEKYDPPIIIFVNQKNTVDLLFSRLSTFGFRVAALHGGKGQEQRELAISQLRNGTKEILIATDVASRGLDIRNVSLVINYDMAKTIEDYVHRVGRTGRAGKTGVAVTFLTEKDNLVFYDLRLQLQKSSKSIIPLALANHEAARVKPGTIIQKRRHEEKVFAYGL